MIVGMGDFFTVHREKETQLLSDNLKFRGCNSNLLASIVAHASYFASVFPKSGEVIGDAAYAVTQARGSVQKAEAWGNVAVASLNGASVVLSVLAPMASAKSPSGALSMPKAALAKFKDTAGKAADAVADNTMGGGMAMATPCGVVLADGTAVAGTVTVAAAGGWPAGLGALAAMSKAADEGTGVTTGNSEILKTQAQMEFDVELGRLNDELFIARRTVKRLEDPHSVIMEPIDIDGNGMSGGRVIYDALDDANLALAKAGANKSAFLKAHPQFSAGLSPSDLSTPMNSRSAVESYLYAWPKRMRDYRAEFSPSLMSAIEGDWIQAVLTNLGDRVLIAVEGRTYVLKYTGDNLAITPITPIK